MAIKPLFLNGIQIPYNTSTSSLSFAQTFFAGGCFGSSLKSSAFRFRDTALMDGSSSIRLTSSSSIMTISPSSTRPVQCMYMYFKVGHLQFSVVTLKPCNDQHSDYNSSRDI